MLLFSTFSEVSFVKCLLPIKNAKPLSPILLLLISSEVRLVGLPRPIYPAPSKPSLLFLRVSEVRCVSLPNSFTSLESISTFIKLSSL